MKRQMALFLSFCCLCFASSISGAQDAVATAAREELTEKVGTLSARVESLEQEIHAFQNRITKLSEENFQMRGELDRLKKGNENEKILERLNRLQDAIKQVDEARLDDNKKAAAKLAVFQAAMDKGFRSLSSQPALQIEKRAPAPSGDDGPKNTVKTPPSNSKNNIEPPAGSSEYTIKKGDTLSSIVGGLRAQNYKVSQKQVEDVNPGVNWGKLRVGQKIVIPPPAP